MFLAKLTKENPEVARRVMEVRTAYASQDFEWDVTKGLAVKAMETSNAEILKRHLMETMRISDEMLGTRGGKGEGESVDAKRYIDEY